MPKLVSTYCTECDGDKNHKRLYSKTAKSKYTKTVEEFCVVECLGCNTVSFLLLVQVSKRSKPIHFNYPDDVPGSREVIFMYEEYVRKLPKTIRKLYEELLSAFNENATVLSGMGLRALVEAVCIDQSIAGRNLQTKIKGLYDQGWISKSELPILDNLRLIGNDSAHRIKSWPMRKLEFALGIINHILISIYILPKIDLKLKQA